MESVKNNSQSLLLISRRLFICKGYANVSIENICQEAKISINEFYQHYESKNVCFADSVRYHLQCVHDYSNYQIDGVCDFIELAYDRMIERTSIGTAYDVLKMLQDAERYIQNFKEIYQISMIMEEKAWTMALEASQQRGEIELKISTEEAAKMFIYVHDGISMRGLTNLSGYDVANNIRDAWYDLYNIIKVQA